MRYIAVLVFALFCISTKAQTYYPFPTNYGYWACELLDDFSQPTGWYETYKLSGDTVINTMPYKKVYKNEYNYRGGLRELNKVVYFLPADSVNEKVIYNFNLNVGDTLFNTYGEQLILSEIDTLVVNQIDSVLCVDGNYHKQYRIGSANQVMGPGDYVIEGVGALHGFLTPMYVYTFSGYPRLNCMSNDSTLIYNLQGAFCFTGLEENIVKAPLDIYPNPATNYVTVKGSAAVKSITIYSADGVFIKNVTHSNTVDISGLCNGMYNLAIETGKAVINRRLVILK